MLSIHGSSHLPLVPEGPSYRRRTEAQRREAIYRLRAHGLLRNTALTVYPIVLHRQVRDLLVA